MTGDDCRVVLRMLSVAYPHMEMSAAAAVLWAKHLSAFELEDAMSAADKWISAEDRPPRISNLVEMSRAEMARRQSARPTLPSAERAMPREQLLKMMAVTRGLLKEWNRKREEHWHGGPEPCPVCGGMRAARHVGAYRDADDRVIPGPEISQQGRQNDSHILR